MNLVQALSYRGGPVGHPLGPIQRALCQGRCCAHRPAPVFLTFGVRGLRLLCVDCRGWQQQLIQARIREIRRAA